MIEKYFVTTPGKEDSSMSDNTNDTNDEDEGMSEEMSDDMVEEELEALNSHLDNLGTYLDNLEKKNDDIHAQLVELLEANRQVKMLFQDESAPKEEPMKE
ncbi:bublin coiled-coil protein [Ischnura elegans]|uniref:bublin coiled-coil protein n=1 Tax=Ischnura elegans TaxID=197161 RepID=UPI001ED8800B|nr:bublin coiled-coil protein [Ischnura elegans]